MASTLRYIVDHIFMPPRLPQEDDNDLTNRYALCLHIREAAEAYMQKLPPSNEKSRWVPIAKMLVNIELAHDSEALSEARISKLMGTMRPDDVLAFLIREQNACLIMRMLSDRMVFESFEVSLQAGVVMGTKGKLHCSYPGPAVAVPQTTANDPFFRKALASFLAQMDVDILDSAATTVKAKSTVREERDTAHPRFITYLLTEILLGMGQAEEVPRITKRIADDVLWSQAFKPWRRSPIWLVIRVALQTSLYRIFGSHIEYKSFMVFMTAYTLHQGLKEELSSDLLFCMRAKMSRRLYKLGSAAPDFLCQYVKTAAERAEGLLQRRWKQVQHEQAKSPRWSPEELDINADTHLSLLSSRPHLTQMLDNTNDPRPIYKFEPNHFSRFSDIQDALNTVCEGRLPLAIKENGLLALADFELMIQDDLDGWVEDNLRKKHSATTIAKCISNYYSEAFEHYATIPEALSIMLLTLFELWVALDKIAVEQCPLLREFSPEVPVGLLERLLLRTAKSIHRLKLIEEYVKRRFQLVMEMRHDRRPSVVSVFTSDSSENTFAVRYFDSSQEHQQLRVDIENQARHRRQMKLDELTRLNDEHARLLNDARLLDHEYWVNSRGRSIHSRSCKKCRLEARANKMKIHVDEWPLPQHEDQAKIAVFELLLPPIFREWREATYQILHDICTAQTGGVKSTPRLLHDYVGLKDYKHNSTSRITLSSETKCFSNTHYRGVQIPARPDDVCLNNGLRLRLFDKSRNEFIDWGRCGYNIARYCRIQLPSDADAYKPLQNTIHETAHTSNNVIANQCDCPQSMTLREYIAFASLRSGSNLQWLNIARELPARSLSFRAEAVHTLISQTAWEVGPLVAGDRVWHMELKSAQFGNVLLIELNDLLTSIQANWLEAVSAKTIIVLTNRLLASAHDSQVVNRAYALLRKVRTVTFGWLRQLKARLQANKSDDQIRELQLRICEVAATCRSTYDVGTEHAPLLLSGPEDVSVLLTCAITVHENTPERLPLELRRLLHRDCRLYHSLQPLLHMRINSSREGLDQVLAATWTQYRSGPEWRFLDAPNERWVVTTTAGQAGYCPQFVQLNILDGELLVEGKPLGRLPSKIVKHPFYRRILGQEILDVIPADLPGMEFATRENVHGYQHNKLFFGMRGKDDLVIRASKEKELFELVPHHYFSGDLPALLVDEYVHWLNLATREIELRKTDNFWHSSPQNWRIYFSVQSHSEMRHGAQSSVLLIDVRSQTMDMVAETLAPLESKTYLTITYNCHILSVDLPRLKLTFSLDQDGNDSRLESQNMPGMVIDANQSSGTMFGLVNQLILCTKKGHNTDPQLRRVIIPGGDVQFASWGRHVRVIICTGSKRDVRYHEYTIDTELGRLVGNVTMISKLYKIYLHALTSHCLDDPLMARTGTEEALHELRSAGCLSFQKLGTEEREMLSHIASLTPRRTFYPAHLKVMQTIKWLELAPLAQHYSFHSITQSILDYANELQVIHQEEPVSRSPCRGEVYLLERAACRNAQFFPDAFAGILPGSQDDRTQVTRDIQIYQDNTDDRAVAEISSMVHKWPLRLNTYPRLVKKLNCWGNVHGRSDGLISVAYCRDWFESNLAEIWISLYDLCRTSSREKIRFSLAFSLAALAYGSPGHRELIPTILSFAILPQFRELHPPPWHSYVYELGEGFSPQSAKILNIVSGCVVEFGASPEVSLIPYPGEDTVALGKRRYSAYECRRASEAERLVGLLLNQWPCEQPQAPSNPHDWLFDIPLLMSKAGVLFQKWYRNSQLHEHICQVQAILDQARCTETTAIERLAFKIPSFSISRQSSSSRISLDELMRRDPPAISAPPEFFSISLSQDTITSPPSEWRCLQSNEELKALLSEFQLKMVHGFHQLYGRDLDHSRRSLNDCPKIIAPSHPAERLKEAIERHRNQCQQHLEEVLACIRRALQPTTVAEEIMLVSGQWPKLTIISLLDELAFRPDTKLREPWKDALIRLAQSLLWLQRSQRALSVKSSQDRDQCLKELESVGKEDADIIQNPSWLLVQIDNNFLVRPIQARVAQEMIAPSSHQNTTMQLNMGEGKSSVIVPLIAATLSDGSKLVRVVVLKSLATQMFQLLVERCSRLANRRIFYMPFQRTGTLTLQHVQLFPRLYADCMRVGGILVIQPEHILSFKLMGIERLSHATNTTERAVADRLLQSQRWLDATSRDILDESDEILHVRYQLIYSVGPQRSLEGHPDRWTNIQQILGLVRKCAPRVKRKLPLGIEVQQNRPGCYPHIRILQSSAGAKLVKFVAQEVIDGALPSCSLDFLPRRSRRAAHRFITDMAINEADASELKEHCKGTCLWLSLLLLRGLFAHGVLLYALKERRWRVDYGLDHSRSLLAVPYRAKDVPSPRAEFGHPDVTIVLTSLSYYYSGLEQTHLDQCFDLLFKQDDARLEYEKWVRASREDKTFPEELCQLSGVNTSDLEQKRTQIFPLFGRNHAVIDFFLSHVVFPRTAKEFPYKLATSAWDLAETKKHSTTGFSGTNDSRYLLPTSIIQSDPVGQLSTNARVLTYLLQSENGHYLCTQEEAKVPSATDFLGLLVKQNPRIQVLLDVGAQMLELRNKELAERWLRMTDDQGMLAVIFFDDDRPSVMTRDGMVEEFMTSPFNRRMEKCLVYLDDSHTRGTDFKLPHDSRAAVTLGPKVTKDRLLQGCMRMRMLGHGQSVMFFAPLEVDRRIRELRDSTTSRSACEEIKVIDILRWVMNETCADVIHHIPHWIQQGIDHKRRQSNAVASPTRTAEELKSSWIQPEGRTLAQMYGPLERDLSSQKQDQFPEIFKRCEELGVDSVSPKRMDGEEQEREVVHEIETEREVERPPKANAAEHQFHEHVRELVQTGIIPRGSTWFIPIFQSLCMADPAAQLHTWSTRLLATRDFSITIQSSAHNSDSEYLRPVNWILSSVDSGGPFLVILSPYEVNVLLPEIRQSKKVHLHQYSPKVAESMKSFEDLTFYCIPPLSKIWIRPSEKLMIQLNLWSGQLYLADHKTYRLLCQFLGLASDKDRTGDIPIQIDGFIKPEHRSGRKFSDCGFEESPVKFLNWLISLRQKGMSYTSTHMGKILRGKALKEEDFHRHSGSVAARS